MTFNSPQKQQRTSLEEPGLTPAQHEKLLALEAPLAELSAKEDGEILQLREKYLKLKEPHFQQRDAALREMPHFWLTAMSNHPQIGPCLTEQDLAVLQHLTDVRLDRSRKEVVRLILSFEDNPYFEDNELIRDVRLNTSAIDASDEEDGDDEQEDGELHIRWKPGMNYTLDFPEEEAEEGGASSMAAGKKRKLPSEPSFFDALKSDSMLAEVLVEDLYPRAWEHFTNDHISESEFDDDDDDDDDDVAEDDEAGNAPAGEQSADEEDDAPAGVPIKGGFADDADKDTEDEDENDDDDDAGEGEEEEEEEEEEEGEEGDEE